MTEQKNPTKLLTAENIQQIILRVGPDAIMDMLIQALEESIHKLDSENTIIPIRSGFNYVSPQPGLIEWMPLYRNSAEVVIKVVGYHPNNPASFQLPTILSNITAYDTTTGHLKGIMDGVIATALRTGAASALATKYAASGQSKTLGLVGCGAQAVTQLHALSRIFDLENVYYFDIDSRAVQFFPDRVEVLNLNCKLISATLSKVLSSSDIICTATSIDIGAGPLFSSQAELKSHVHINAVGSDFPGKVELPLELVKDEFIFPDFIEQAMIEGECQSLNREQINADFKAIIQDPIRFDFLRNQISVFDSTGWSLEDAVVYDLFMEQADLLNIGKSIELEFVPEDAKNPYHFLSINKLEPMR